MLNALNALDVSGMERDVNSREYKAASHPDSEFGGSGQVNDKLIDDIQKRLELLDEFK